MTDLPLHRIMWASITHPEAPKDMLGLACLAVMFAASLYFAAALDTPRHPVPPRGPSGEVSSPASQEISFGRSE